MSTTPADATAPLGGVEARPRRATVGRNLAETLRRRGGGIAHGLVVIAAGILWIAALRVVDLEQISDLGLVTALPAAAFAALALATASFALVLRREDVSTPLAVLHLVILVTMLHGASSLVDPEPASHVVWRHAGVTDLVLATGTVDPTIDAYFNWPGFFFLTALATRAAGLDSALGLSNWAPVAFELLYLPALVVIARAFSSDRRVMWSAVWIFYMTNWVGQDYLSPQAMGYLLYLALMAVVLTGLSRVAAPDLARWRERGAGLLLRVGARRPGVALAEAPVGADVSPAQRAALVPVCVIVIIAAVGSHQLTPFMMLSSLLALVWLRRSTARGLPAITALLLLAWMAYLATAYLDGHLKPLLGQTLDLQGAVAANVSGRLQGSEHHLLVVRLRLLMSALVWALAVAGAVRGLRRGAASPSHALLMMAPAGLAVLQPYGGEMLMRVYLFALPFAACFVAQAVMPSSAAPAWRVTAVLAAVGTLLVAGFLFTRYGNERTAVFTAAEVQAVERLYSIAPHGSLLVAGSPNLPWKGRHYADYRYQLLSRQLDFGGRRPSSARLAAQVARYLRGYRAGRAYLVITRSQRVYDAVLGAPKWGSTSDLERAVMRSPQFTKLFDNGDGRIFTLRRGAPGRSLP